MVPDHVLCPQRLRNVPRAHGPSPRQDPQIPRSPESAFLSGRPLRGHAARHLWGLQRGQHRRLARKGAAFRGHPHSGLPALTVSDTGHMTMCRSVIFDLDGTLTDSKPGILGCSSFAPPSAKILPRGSSKNSTSAATPNTPRASIIQKEPAVLVSDTLVYRSSM